MSRVTEAERQDARFNWHTVAEAGALLGDVADDTVRQWIADGELTALDVSKAGAKRKEYRIRPEWIAAFEARRILNPEHARIPAHIVEAALRQHAAEKQRAA